MDNPPQTSSLLAQDLSTVSDVEKGLALGAWDAEPGFVDAASRRIGISSVVGVAFRCILPGHNERHPSARLCRDREGRIVYHDMHQREKSAYFTLAEVYAAVRKGITARLRPPELATWKIRLLVESGICSTYPVDMKPAPVDLTASGKKVYEGFRLLLGCKWLYAPYEPTMFSQRFAAAWCGVKVHEAACAIKMMLDRKIAQVVPNTTKYYGKPLQLYIPIQPSGVEEV